MTHETTTGTPRGDEAVEPADEWLLYPPVVSQFGVLVPQMSEAGGPVVQEEAVEPPHGKDRVSGWKKLGASCLYGVAFAIVAVVPAGYPFSAPQPAEISAPANQLPGQENDSTVEDEATGVGNYLSDTGRNDRLQSKMVETATKVLAAVQAGELKPSSMVDPYGFEAHSVGDHFEGNVVMKGARNGVNFTVQAYRLPDGKYSFDPKTISLIALDPAKPKNTDVGAAIASPTGALFGVGDYFTSVVLNSGLGVQVEKDNFENPELDETYDIYNSSREAKTLGEAKGLDDTALGTVDQLVERLLK